MIVTYLPTLLYLHLGLANTFHRAMSDIVDR